MKRVRGRSKLNNAKIAQMAKKKRLVLLDTHAILHRAYHALPDFSSSKGEPTGALYGLITMLVKIITDLKPDYIVAAYDLPKPTYRHIAYKEYKATRVKTADDLVAQIIRSRDVIKAFGIPVYDCEGFEADDVIGTITEELKKEKDVDVIIASGDMDTLQLVDDERVRVYTLKKGISDTILYDQKGVEARFGFVPGLIPDYKGLRGDPSDNIPGVKGIGEKTAGVMISKFGTLEKLYAVLKKNPEKLEAAGIKEGMIEKLKEQEENAHFSKMLAEIRRDAPINFSLPEKLWKEAVEPQKLFDLISELEFRSLGPRVQKLFGTEAISFGDDPAGESEEERAKNAPPQDELQKLAVAVWLLDSSITEPELEDIYRIAKTRDFAEAKKNIEAEIEKRGLSFVYKDIELPLMPVLRRMEERGILVDKKFLKKLSDDYHKKLDILAANIYKLAGQEFNIN